MKIFRVIEEITNEDLRALATETQQSIDYVISQIEEHAEEECLLVGYRKMLTDMQHSLQLIQQKQI